MTQATSFFTDLPKPLISAIASFCDSNTQSQLSITCKKVKSATDEARSVLAVTIPWSHWLSNTHTPSSLLVNFLTRFSNITTLALTEGYQTFTKSEIDIINRLVLFLQTNYPKKLAHVKLRELELKSEFMQQAFLSSFGHSQTLSLEIANQSNGSVITDQMINSALEKSPNLISFTFIGFQLSSDIKLKIQFSKCQKIEKVRLEKIPVITNETINDLLQCRNLTELSITNSYRGITELEQFLCTNHGLKLRVLDLEDTRCLTNDKTLDLATKHLINLEFFSRKSFDPNENKISDQGLFQLANNCKKLNTLVFNFENITDQGLLNFALNASQLKKLSTFQMTHITHQGMCDFAQHCKQLKALELIHFYHLTPAVLLALAKNCETLQFLRISFCKSQGVTLEDLMTFVSTCKSLKYLGISDCTGISNAVIKILNKENPHIQPNLGTFYTI